ncbi:sigma-70 family RNA polymerase sigma factor [Paenibacillus tengchongensis]|uniref:sigma-70 family RNA polymerase sigma factor n=1 Tax=Paenibacillus tengchongensis TaxID=2608684 RepID=UPI00124F68E6|nr:sigma-70 family RNA polymerase sigma factor [Paenibacillus tengchongensis]
MEQWMKDVKAGDEEAFGRLMAHFRGMAYAVSYDRLQDAHLAEDAVQEAYLEAYLNLGKLREPAAFPGWFRTIVVRQCQRMLRRKRLSVITLDEAGGVPLTTQEDVAETAERREVAHALRSLVQELPATLRVPVQLFYFYGYSLPEVSAYLGIPAAVLKKRLYDGRRKLKAALPVSNPAAMFGELYEGGANMLHIVNGDVVGDMLKQGIVQGEVLVWREIYSYGPVFCSGAGEQERMVRAQALEEGLGIPQEQYLASCAEQERRLGGFRRYDEVVLWFEHDLFDQSMLAFLLHWFSGRPLGSTRLSLLCIGEFPGIERFHGLGQLTPGQLQSLSGTWRTIGREELKLGRELWEAYASSDPLDLVHLLNRERKRLEAMLPYAEEAFTAHLSRLPSVFNGLGIVEQATLEAIHGGADTPLELFRQVTDQLHVLGMGDLEYFRYFGLLAKGPHALIHIDGAEGIEAAGGAGMFRAVPDFLKRKVALTGSGEQVLSGQADRVTLQGVDAWLGPLRLEGHEVPWRWNCRSGAPVRT